MKKTTSELHLLEHPNCSGLFLNRKHKLNPKPQSDTNVFFSDFFLNNVPRVQGPSGSIEFFEKNTIR